jgi:hypothetical protein
MVTVADCLRQHGEAFLRSSESTPLQVRKVLSAITRCRTGDLGSIVYRCDGCGRDHWVGRSCGNRHCPSCQHEKTQDWLQKQTDRLLPVHHFLVTFTVPQEVHDVIRAQRKIGFDAIFAAGAKTLRARTARSRYLKDGELGFFGVLHTWGRDLRQFHPHVHFVVPGGTISKDGTKWLSTPTNFLFYHGTVIEEYRKFFRQEMQREGLLDQIPAAVWQQKWVVDIKPVGNGQAVLKYLAPYVHRIAISDMRIVECDEQSVTYRWTPSKTKTSKTRKVTGEQFVQSFVQHVLPQQFQKVRHYGWMSSNSRFDIEKIRWLVWLWLGWTYWLGSGMIVPDKRKPEPLRCEHCGGHLQLLAIIATDGRVLVNHGVRYLDSG